MATRLFAKARRDCDLRRVRDDASDFVGAQFALRIDNWGALRAAHGAQACRAAQEHLLSLFHQSMAENGLTPFPSEWLLLENDALYVRLPRHALPQEGDRQAWLENVAASLCAVVTLSPFECSGSQFNLALSYHPASAWPASSERMTGELTPVDCLAETEFAIPSSIDLLSSSAQSQRFCADFAEAAKLLAALAADDIHIAWQPVRRISAAGETLYYEALLREGTEGSRSFAPIDAIRAMERLALTRALDVHVLGKVLDQLEAHPSVILAANISAQSAVDDYWWKETVRRLHRRRDVACRLVIEITETADAAPSKMIAFVDGMRSLGCRIALDDFGVGFASIRRLLALSPDIVKIDSLFVRRAPQSQRDKQILAHMIGLARAIAPCVIVEGIETDDQFWLADELGVEWAQGALTGGPSAIRSWTLKHEMLTN